MKIAVVDNIAAHYRLLLFQKLSQHRTNEYFFFASERTFNGIKTIDPELAIVPVDRGGIRWTFIDNVILSGRIFWQKKVISLARKGEFDIYIFIGEALMISTWFAAMICKLRNKKVVFWGHGLYGNENFFKKKLRNCFNKLPHAYLLYNERARSLLIQSGIKADKLFVVNNSLNHDEHLALRSSISTEEISDLKARLFPLTFTLPVVVFIGRLTHVKKIDQLLKAIIILHNRNRKLNVLIIGKGDMESELKKMVADHNLAEYVNFFGSCYDERENALMISMADCCVSPGNSGLIAIHCMSFGTPLVTHNDLNNQMPEVETVKEDITGELFEKDNVNDLAEKIDRVLVNGKQTHYSNNCINLIDKYYNPDYQLKVFDNLCDYLT